MYHTFVLSSSPVLTLCYRNYPPSEKKITNSLFASLLFPALDLYSIYIKLCIFFLLYFLSLILKLKEEKGASDFGNEVTAAIPRFSTCYLPVFLMEKSGWALQVVKGTRCF